MSYNISSLNGDFVESRSHALDLYKSLNVLECDNRFDNDVTITSNGSIHVDCGFATSFGSFGERYASNVDISNDYIYKHILCFNGGIDDVPKALSEVLDAPDLSNLYKHGLKSYICKNIVCKDDYDVIADISCRAFIKKLLNDSSLSDIRIAYVIELLNNVDGVVTYLDGNMGADFYNKAWKIFNSFIATLKFNFPDDSEFLDSFAEDVESDTSCIDRIVESYTKYSNYIDSFICRIYSLIIYDRFRVGVDAIECIIWYFPDFVCFIDSLNSSALSALPYKRLLTKKSYTIENILKLHGFDVMWNMDNIYMVRIAES